MLAATASAPCLAGSVLCLFPSLLICSFRPSAAGGLGRPRPERDFDERLAKFWRRRRINWAGKVDPVQRRLHTVCVEKVYKKIPTGTSEQGAEHVLHLRFLVETQTKAMTTLLDLGSPIWPSGVTRSLTWLDLPKLEPAAPGQGRGAPLPPLFSPRSVLLPASLQSGQRCPEPNGGSQGRRLEVPASSLPRRPHLSPLQSIRSSVLSGRMSDSGAVGQLRGARRLAEAARVA